MQDKYKYEHNLLLQWFAENSRALPWRETKDPYKIWLSEIILQQTRVQQGYDYYLRFVERFPTVQDLAEAAEDEVLRLWQGLGYYSRARNLHKAAGQVMTLHKGVFPIEYQDVRALQGVGDYTAAAICSFAYDMPVAAVDGNVIRVLSRYFGEATPFDTNAGKKLFQALADEFLNRDFPALHNQAMMELGALCCTPKSPNCEFCPLMETCFAYRSHTQQDLPVRSKRLIIRERHLTYLIYRVSGKTLIHQRKDKDIWQGLFEFPLIEADHLLALNEMQDYVPDGAKITCLPDLTHQLTHQRLHARFYVIESIVFPSVWENEEIILFTDLEHYALSRLTLRALEQIT